MFSVSFDFKSTPLNSNRDNCPDSLRSKGSYNNIRTVSRIFRLNFNMKIRLIMNINFGDKFRRGFFFLFLYKPTFYKTHLIIISKYQIFFAFSLE